MFFAIHTIEQASYNAIGLENPKTAANRMVLAVNRQLMRSALFTVYAKKAFGEFRDSTTGEKIPSRMWTPEMKAFAQQKLADAAKPPFIFKFTIVGWIFVLLVITTFGLIGYNSFKPPVPKSPAYVAMQKAPAVGDIYFGHFESFKEAGERIASEIGFGWFKVTQAEGNTYSIIKSKQMNKSHKPKEELNSTDFESDAVSVRITEQAAYMIHMESTDGKMKVYITDKK